MADAYSHDEILIDSPAVDGFNLTANSTNVFSQPTRALYVGTTGNVCVQMSNRAGTNTVLTFPTVPAGTFMPIRVAIVYANSTANGFVGLY